MSDTVQMYEYLVENKLLDAFELNEYGRNGWELVSAIQAGAICGPRTFFKRPNGTRPVFHTGAELNAYEAAR